MKKTIFLLYLLNTPFLLFAQSPDPKFGTMEKFTDFNFSQHWNLTIPDSQVFHTMPEMIIRGWCQWHNWGTKPSDFNFEVISQYHQKNICFIGGITASVYFFEQAEDSAQFKDMITRDAFNNLIPHNILGQGAFRGNIANPAYRDYLIKMAKIQIDGGADGIFFDEVISGYDGLNYDGNEGFDDYTLKDFNKYLAAKYPRFSKADWIKKFQMTDDNCIKIDQPPDNLDSNFNYRKYLATHGWQSNPITDLNPLAAEWGKVLNNRADTTSNTFLSKYTTKYWKDIVSRLRKYARDTYSKEILITSNGLFPYVDFNSLGMYNGNKDDNGAEANYVPVSSGKLDGSVSLQNVFKSLYQKSRNLSGSVPVVLFLDFPTNILNNYYNLPLNDKKDYWKINVAEAYANGLFVAFHLRTSMPDDPTAAEQGMLDFIENYSGFYKENSWFYHKNEISYLNIKSSEEGINFSSMYYSDSGKYTIHLINHNYIPGKGMIPAKDFTISVNPEKMPNSVYMKSPDFKGLHKLKAEHNGNTMIIKIDSLTYYDVIVMEQHVY